MSEGARFLRQQEPSKGILSKGARIPTGPLSCSHFLSIVNVLCTLHPWHQHVIFTWWSAMSSTASHSMRPLHFGHLGSLIVTFISTSPYLKTVHFRLA